jgi:hypothetical protein
LWSTAVPVHDLPAALARAEDVAVPAPRGRLVRAPDALPAAVTAAIASMRADGASSHTIAAALNRTVGRHPKGVRWTARTVAQAEAETTGDVAGD